METLVPDIPVRRSGIWGLGGVPGLRSKAIISLPIHLSFRTSSCLCLIAVLIMMMLRIAVMRNCNQLNSSRGSPRERALCNPTPDCFGQVPLCLAKASLGEASLCQVPARGCGAELGEPAPGVSSFRVFCIFLSFSSVQYIAGHGCTKPFG